MSSINGINGGKPISGLSPTAAHRSYPGQAQRTVPGDRVELSDLSHMLGKLKANDIRADKVADIKAQIAAGTYEDDHKLDTAIDRMLDDMKL